MNKFKLLKRIGKGSFGKIYLAKDKETKEIIAIKKEDRDKQRLEKEYEICQYLPSLGFVNAYSFFGDEKFNYMTMKLLGSNLDDLFKLCNKKLSLGTVLMFANQTIIRIKQFHEIGFIHQDIKPSNFLMGLDKDDKIIHLIDYGLSKSYIKDNEHIEFNSENKFIGTARYASLNTHMGIVQSRRDDLESLGYIFIYFLKGRLPWQEIGLGATQKEKYKLIKSKKLMITNEKLCHGLPREFYLYMKYCRDLNFTDDPDYNYLVGLFRDLFNKKQFKTEFDWKKIN